MHGNIAMKLPIHYLIQTKMSFFNKGEEKGKIVPVWGLGPVGVGRI
jgi:hypothetical protein